MKAFILVDDTDIIRCIATEENNLHKDKLWMEKYRVKIKGIVGDEYDYLTDTWKSRPENHPKETKKNKKERLIAIQSKLTATELLDNESTGIDWTEELEEFDTEKKELIKEITED